RERDGSVWVELKVGDRTLHAEALQALAVGWVPDLQKAGLAADREEPGVWRERERFDLVCPTVEEPHSRALAGPRPTRQPCPDQRQVCPGRRGAPGDGFHTCILGEPGCEAGGCADAIAWQASPGKRFVGVEQGSWCWVG